MRKSQQAVEFYKCAFGATELHRLEGRAGVVARLAVHGSLFWVSDESEEHGNYSPETLNGTSVRILLTVADPDAVFAQACHFGASVIHPISDEHGWRLGRLVDPFGHHWEIGRPLTA